MPDTTIHRRAYSEPFRLRAGYNSRNNLAATITIIHLPNFFFRRGSCSQLKAAATIPFSVSMTSVTSGTSFSWRSKDNLQELVLSFHSVSLRDGSPVPRLGGKHLCPLDHLLLEELPAASPRPFPCSLRGWNPAAHALGFGLSKFIFVKFSFVGV